MRFDKLFATIITENNNISHDSEELEMGIKIESEHKDVYDVIHKFCKSHGLDTPFTIKEFYTMIAKAHLNEFSNYYTGLENMEESLKKDMPAKIEEKRCWKKQKKNKRPYRFNSETLGVPPQND